MTKTLLITGVSTGFGRALAEGGPGQRPSRGRHSGATEAAKAEFEALKPRQAFRPYSGCHKTPRRVAPTVAEIDSAQSGRSNVLVNNAGYGFEGILEESTLDEVRHQFDVKRVRRGGNDPGRAAFHAQSAARAGSSTSRRWAATSPSPGSVVYNGSKFRARRHLRSPRQGGEGSSASSSPAVGPGSFRTDWAGPLDDPEGTHHRRLRRGLRAGEEADGRR